MSILYGYNDMIWKPEYTFSYTGDPQEFTLDPGKYFIMCSGARGGGFSDDNHWAYGGVSMGILELSSQQTMFAYVGGDGTVGTTSVNGIGGFNGGANGGKPFSSSYKYGNGGGGASDIRLLKPDGIVPIPAVPLGSPLYIKLKITKLRSADSTLIQMERLQFYDIDNNDIMISDISATNDEEDTTPQSIVSPLENLLVDDLMSFKGDWTGVCNIHLQLSNATAVYGYSYTTGHNSAEYDPISFELYFSDDNVTWTKVDEQSDLVISTDRDKKTIVFGTQPVVTPEQQSLLTRIIVAGGAGGAINTTSYNSTESFGGGIVGGFIALSTDPKYLKYADQQSGYSFGIGQVPTAKISNLTNNKYGSSGGGGGWFGGYATSADIEEGTRCGCGGSGYVLTENSFKPEGYNVSASFYMKEPFMNSGVSEGASIIVCKHVDAYNIGDIIRFMDIGKTHAFRIANGTYRIKCYGGEGGLRFNEVSRVKGGYVEGTIKFTKSENLFINVGGSGLRSIFNSPTYAHLANPTYGFNGGGSPDINAPGGCSGGGGTDVRLNNNQLLSRIIVAGGAGGCSKNAGGAGGGTTGKSPSGSYGTCPGPGTQESSPQNADYPIINGNFGYGGNGISINGGSGGGGGGGWFGGSGTYPDSSGDNERGGAGGSGYVLSATSFKPTGYISTDYIFTDIINTQGGNTLQTGISRVDIEVINCSFVYILLKDSQGYKKFDTNENRWVYIASELYDKIFEEHGHDYIPNLNGVDDSFDIVCKDPRNVINKSIINYVPEEQHIITDIKTRMILSRLNIDADYDPEVYNINTVISKSGEGNDTTVRVDTAIKKKQISDKQCRLFAIQLFNK